MVAAGLIYFNHEHRAQKEIDAGQALTQTMISIPRNATVSQQVDLYSKIAANYQGTSGGQRALLQAGAILFAAGKYPEAQAQFQRFLDVSPGSFFAAQAALGLATCLDAQGKTDAAAEAYQRIINTYSDLTVVDSARFALAQLDERQGKPGTAADLYDIIARNNLDGSLAAEAAMRLMELKMKQPSASPAVAAPLSSLPSH